MSERNKLVSRTLIEEVWNRGNFALVDELVSPDFRGHSSSPDMDTRGVDGYREYHRGLRAAFPDLRYTIEDQVAEGDKVVTRWTARGTHQGAFAGIPATGRSGTISGVTTDRIVDGQSVECWTSLDELGLLQQLGVVPRPGQAA
ncbi:MAG: ester cyclase [Candidatus Limnocylindria bacterium]